jgi:hypothetical protein
MLIEAIYSEIFCSRLILIGWLQNHLIPCPFKYLTGIDCPGCGFQRAVIELIQGHLHKSIGLYPSAIPLLIFFLYGLADRFLKLDTSKNSIKKASFMIIGSMMFVSYLIKMYTFFSHYNISA